MKKVLLLLTLLVLALALVACGGEKNPPVTDPSDTDPLVTEPPVTTAANVTYSVKFMDSELFLDENGEQVLLKDDEVKRGKFARAPREPSHEGYVFTGWDVEDYSQVTSDMVITAQYRLVDTYTVQFCDEAGNVLSSVEVTEGGAVVGPDKVPYKEGCMFVGWDKTISRVNREWSDFEAYKDLSEEELAQTEMVFKTTAVYESAGGVIPFVENINFKLKEEKVDGKTVYVPTDVDKFSEAFPYQELYAGSAFAQAGVNSDEQFNKVTVKTKYAWDGEYIYGYIVVEDPTLLSRGKEYCESEVDPWQNDIIECWYKLGEQPTSKTVQRFTIDLYGYHLGAYDGSAGGYNSMSLFFDKMEKEVKVVEETKTSYIFFKLYAKTEGGEALEAGDVFYSTYQVNDLRDLNILANMYYSGSNQSDYANGYENYILGEKK